jgi:hypothetical protein
MMSEKTSEPQSRKEYDQMKSDKTSNKNQYYIIKV